MKTRLRSGGGASRQGDSFLLYCGRALAVSTGGYALLYLLLPSVLGLNLPEALNLVLATVSAGLLRGLGLPVVQLGPILDLPRGLVVVTDLCNGMGEWLLLAGAMLAVRRVSRRMRLLGVVACGLGLMALNVLRIALLAYLRAEAPVWVFPVHEQLAPLGLVLAAASAFVFWVRSVGRGALVR